MLKRMFENDLNAIDVNSTELPSERTEILDKVILCGQVANRIYAGQPKSLHWDPVANAIATRYLDNEIEDASEFKYYERIFLTFPLLRSEDVDQVLRGLKHYEEMRIECSSTGGA